MGERSYITDTEDQHFTPFIKFDHLHIKVITHK